MAPSLRSRNQNQGTTPSQQEKEKTEHLTSTATRSSRINKTGVAAGPEDTSLKSAVSSNQSHPETSRPPKRKAPHSSPENPPKRARPTKPDQNKHNLGAQDSVGTSATTSPAMSEKKAHHHSPADSSSKQTRSNSIPQASLEPEGDNARPQDTRRKSSRHKKSTRDHSPSEAHTSRRSRRAHRLQEHGDEESSTRETSTVVKPQSSRKSSMQDPQTSKPAPAPSPTEEQPPEQSLRRASAVESSMSFYQSLRALQSSSHGMGKRLNDILLSLKNSDEPSLQAVALQDLAQLLLISNEDSLSGHLPVEEFVKELVTLMQPGKFGENPETMLMACRCIANLMEVLPQTTGTIVYGGAVPILCQKLLDIQYIDLAEQALTTLSKISVEYPSEIVREGGLGACLTFLDFFATSTQRVAVTTAANCCRNLSEDSYSVVKEVVPILQGVLHNSDQRVIEQGCLCVSRIIESYRHHAGQLEGLITTDLFQAILRLLLPGSTNMISSKIVTSFLRVLGYAAKISPNLSAELIRLDVVEMLFQILTGTSAPDEATQVEQIVVMQALIHRPRDHIYEALTLVGDLFPSFASTWVSGERISVTWDDVRPVTDAKERQASMERRRELLVPLQDKVRRLTCVLLPTLTYAYMSTVNVSIRTKVLSAQLKILSSVDVHILEDALRTIPYASFLAGVLSQQEVPMLLLFAVESARLLRKRLPNIYRVEFYRQGVMKEVQRLSEQEVKPSAAAALTKAKSKAETDRAQSASHERKDALTNVAQQDTAVPVASGQPPASQGSEVSEPQMDSSQMEGVDDGNDEDDDDDEEDDDDDEMDEDEDPNEEVQPPNEANSLPTPAQQDSSIPNPVPQASSLARHHHRTNLHAKPPSMNDITQALCVKVAKDLLSGFNDAADIEARDQALSSLNDMKELATNIEEANEKTKLLSLKANFVRLAGLFSASSTAITGAELLDSGIITMLLKVLQPSCSRFADQSNLAHADIADSNTQRDLFREAFVDGEKSSQGGVIRSLIEKLQEVLSRSEQFEVHMLYPGGNERSRHQNDAVLHKQIKLRLEADKDSGIAKSFRTLIVSIHAISRLKALEDYLKPRIEISGRSLAERTGLSHAELSKVLASLTAGLPPHEKAAFEQEIGKLHRYVGDGEGEETATSPKNDKAEASTSAEGSTQAIPERIQQHRKSRIQELMDESLLHQARLSQNEGEDQASDEEEPADQTYHKDDDDSSDDEHDDDDDERNIIFEEHNSDDYLDELENRLADGVNLQDSAVNLEVAASGAVTARTGAGDRVRTPTKRQSIATGASRDASKAKDNRSPARAQDNLAITATPATASASQNFHLEFMHNGVVLKNSSTIFGAVRHVAKTTIDASTDDIWSRTHTIKMRKVPGASNDNLDSVPDPEDDSAMDVDTLPPSLQTHPITSQILQLLDLLHNIVASPNISRHDTTIQTLFVNSKLTAKLNRQLEEALFVASKCLPSWCSDLMKHYPFLFPFETRHIYLQSTAFGYVRAMARWQSQLENEDTTRNRSYGGSPFGRIVRQKVRVSRSRIVESATKVMEIYGASDSILEVEYFDEVGTGLGPTLEFYAMVSKDFSLYSSGMWRGDASDDGVHGGQINLFPAPVAHYALDKERSQQVHQFFSTLGKFAARALVDSRTVEIPFSPAFFELDSAQSGDENRLRVLRQVDPGLANSLDIIKEFVKAKQNIDESDGLSASEKDRQIARLVNEGINGITLDDLGLEMTLPGYPGIDLTPGGADDIVTIESIGHWYESVIDLTVGSGVQKQFESFRSGFNEIIPYAAMRAFSSLELTTIFGQIEEDWSVEALLDAIKADHGYNMDSSSVKNLVTLMSSLDDGQRRDFLQFTTGSPRLPLGGFKALTPTFTIVCRPADPPYTPDDYLPSVMTCANYLKLPNYSNLEIMRKKIMIAIHEGQGAFHLS